MSKKSFIEKYSIIGVYLVALTMLAGFSAVSDMNRTEISDLNLSGYTVHQVKEILDSEGYDPDDYTFITKTGVKPGSAWTVEKIEDARKGQIFVKTESLPTLESLQILGSTWNAAEKILERSGYFNGSNLIADSEGKTVWFGTSWIVSSIHESVNGSTPIVKLSKVEAGIDKNAEVHESKEKSDFDINAVIGQRLPDAQSILRKAGWSDREFTQRSDTGNLIFIHGGWIVSKIEEDAGILIMTVTKITSQSSE